MLRYIVKRVIAGFLSLFMLITLTFFLMHVIPGGPFSPGEYRKTPPEVLKQIQDSYGLNDPIYAQYGRYLNKVDSFEFPGLSGMDTMAGIMQKFRDNPPADIAGYKVVKVTDYKKPEETGLPAANVLIYKLENNETVVVRPSGTEPKIKIYYTTLGKDLAEAEAEKEKLAKALEPMMA